ncbi:hypothetical protein [Azospirillum soli]|uniref:hypothetical protein n=1 Tax=Azospirillum soli TaxID=1304799 RepID=UPI001AE529F3|nr:hypothetical protein [Azospirillum soli]MBP2316138.1 hypothetical protein [Azospirillum soli]
MQVQAVGIPWYRREDWETLKRLFADADKLHDAYDQWLVSAEKLAKHLKAKGMIVEQVPINPDEFANWCGIRRKPLDAKARNDFANEFVARKHFYGNR